MQFIQSGEDAMRKKLTLRVENDLIQQAKIHGINISRLTEQTLADSVGKCRYMHVQSDIGLAEMQSTQNSRDSALHNEAGWHVGVSAHLLC